MEKDHDPKMKSNLQNSTSMFEKIWGIKFDSFLPYEVYKGFNAVRSNLEKTMSFTAQFYNSIFESDPSDIRFLPDPLTDIKKRYYQENGEFFEFIHKEKTVGFLILTPHDWTTCYIRGAGLLPEHQGTKVISRFLSFLEEPFLKAGIERMEADTSPSNFAVLHILMRQRYNPTGTVLTDRWGAHVKLTKFLLPQSEDKFLKQYCTGIEYQKKGKTNNIKNN